MGIEKKSYSDRTNSFVILAIALFFFGIFLFKLDGSSNLTGYSVLELNEGYAEERILNYYEQKLNLENKIFIRRVSGKNQFILSDYYKDLLLMDVFEGDDEDSYRQVLEHAKIYSDLNIKHLEVEDAFRIPELGIFAVAYIIKGEPLKELIDDRISFEELSKSGSSVAVSLSKLHNSNFSIQETSDYDKDILNKTRDNLKIVREHLKEKYNSKFGEDKYFTYVSNFNRYSDSFLKIKHSYGLTAGLKLEDVYVDRLDPAVVYLKPSGKISYERNLAFDCMGFLTDFRYNLRLSRYLPGVIDRVEGDYVTSYLYSRHIGGGEFVATENLYGAYFSSEKLLEIIDSPDEDYIEGLIKIREPFVYNINYPELSAFFDESWDLGLGGEEEYVQDTGSESLESQQEKSGKSDSEDEKLSSFHLEKPSEVSFLQNIIDFLKSFSITGKAVGKASDFYEPIVNPEPYNTLDGKEVPVNDGENLLFQTKDGRILVISGTEIPKPGNLMIADSKDGSFIDYGVVVSGYTLKSGDRIFEDEDSFVLVDMQGTITSRIPKNQVNVFKVDSQGRILNLNEVHEVHQINPNPYGEFGCVSESCSENCVLDCNGKCVSLQSVKLELFQNTGCNQNLNCERFEFDNRGCFKENTEKKFLELIPGYYGGLNNLLEMLDNSGWPDYLLDQLLEDMDLSPEEQAVAKAMLKKMKSDPKSGQICKITKNFINELDTRIAFLENTIPRIRRNLESAINMDAQNPTPESAETIEITRNQLNEMIAEYNSKLKEKSDLISSGKTESVTEGIYDCDGKCIPKEEYMGYIGDGECNPNLHCSKLDYSLRDSEDCKEPEDVYADASEKCYESEEGEGPLKRVYLRGKGDNFEWDLAVSVDCYCTPNLVLVDKGFCTDGKITLTYEDRNYCKGIESPMKVEAECEKYTYSNIKENEPIEPSGSKQEEEAPGYDCIPDWKPESECEGGAQADARGDPDANGRENYYWLAEYNDGCGNSIKIPLRVELKQNKDGIDCSKFRCMPDLKPLQGFSSECFDTEVSGIKTRAKLVYYYDANHCKDRYGNIILGQAMPSLYPCDEEVIYASEDVSSEQTPEAVLDYGECYGIRKDKKILTISEKNNLFESFEIEVDCDSSCTPDIQCTSENSCAQHVRGEHNGKYMGRYSCTDKNKCGYVEDFSAYSECYDNEEISIRLPSSISKEDRSVSYEDYTFNPVTREIESKNEDERDYESNIYVDYNIGEDGSLEESYDTGPPAPSGVSITGIDPCEGGKKKVHYKDYDSGIEFTLTAPCDEDCMPVFGLVYSSICIKGKRTIIYSQLSPSYCEWYTEGAEKITVDCEDYTEESSSSSDESSDESESAVSDERILSNTDSEKCYENEDGSLVNTITVQSRGYGWTQDFEIPCGDECRPDLILVSKSPCHEEVQTLTYRSLSTGRCDWFPNPFEIQISCREISSSSDESDTAAVGGGGGGGSEGSEPLTPEIEEDSDDSEVEEENAAEEEIDENLGEENDPEEDGTGGEEDSRCPEPPQGEEEEGYDPFNPPQTARTTGTYG